MNKKQEALRRELRSFIAETLQELEALEERPAPRETPPAAASSRPPHAEPGDRTVANGPPPPAPVPRPALPRIEPDVHPAPPTVTTAAPDAGPATQAEPGADGTAGTGEAQRAAARSRTARIVVPGRTETSGVAPRIMLPAGDLLKTASPVVSASEPAATDLDAAGQIAPRAGRAEIAAAEDAVAPDRSPSLLQPLAAEPAPAAPGVPIHDRESGAEPPETVPVRTRARRAERVAPRKRPRQRTRLTGDVATNGANRDQAHGRKGVCFAYFVNQECWRVADAYCNSALQVCITRECPVYQLHKESLERRFAKKFKHFW